MHEEMIHLNVENKIIKHIDNDHNIYRRYLSVDEDNEYWWIIAVICCGLLIVACVPVLCMFCKNHVLNQIIYSRSVVCREKQLPTRQSLGTSENQNYKLKKGVSRKEYFSNV